MQENNFEQQVRQLMDDLQITPGEPVWEYVEKRIPKSNRRRRFIAFFLLFAGISVCGYFFYNKFEGNTKTVAANETVATTKQNNNVANNTTANEIKPQQNSAADNTTVPAYNSLNKDTHEITTRSDNTSATKETNDTKKENIKQVISNASIDLFSAPSSSEENKQKDEIVASKQIKEDKTSATEISQPAIASSEKSNDSKSIQPDSINNVAVLINKTDTASTINSSATKKEEAKAKKDLKQLAVSNKKIQWGITGFYGRSNAVENFAEGIGIGSSTDKSLSDAVSNPGTNWDSAAFLSYSKAVTAKSSFSIGAIIKKQFTPRSSVRTGIQYTRISTQIKIGTQKDTLAILNYNNSGITTRLENYYRPGLSGSHINKYNLIQIPFIYSYQINKGKSFPLVVDGGFTLSRIISSDALVYDSYNQAYYKNSNLINKTQVTFSTGFHSSLSFKHAGTLEFGPQLQYGLNNVVKNNNTSQHIFLWGLNATYFLKRK